MEFDKISLKRRKPFGITSSKKRRKFWIALIKNSRKSHNLLDCKSKFQSVSTTISSDLTLPSVHTNKNILSTPLHQIISIGICFNTDIKASVPDNIPNIVLKRCANVCQWTFNWSSYEIIPALVRYRSVASCLARYEHYPCLCWSIPGFEVQTSVAHICFQ